MVKITSVTEIPNTGIVAETASEIFDQIGMFAGYGFNKSHAAAYAAISFQTAYLKTHHPECYFSAAMNLELGEVDEIATFATELDMRNIMLWAPDVNMSTEAFRPVPLRKLRAGRSHAISYGLSALRGVGMQAARDIVTERSQNGPFSSVKDFVDRMGGKVNNKGLNALIHAGAFDRLISNRAEAASQGKTTRHSAAAPTQMSMFEMVPELDTAPEVEEYDADTRLDLEFDVLGHYLSDHPLREWRKVLFENNQYFSGGILDSDREPPRQARMAAVVCDTDLRRTKKGDIMAVIRLSDPDRSYEVLAFGDTWSKIKPFMKKKSRVELTVTVISDDAERRLIAEDAQFLSKGNSLLDAAA